MVRILTILFMAAVLLCPRSAAAAEEPSGVLAVPFLRKLREVINTPLSSALSSSTEGEESMEQSRLKHQAEVHDAISRLKEFSDPILLMKGDQFASLREDKAYNLPTSFMEEVHGTAEERYAEWRKKQHQHEEELAVKQFAAEPLPSTKPLALLIEEEEKKIIPGETPEQKQWRIVNFASRANGFKGPEVWEQSEPEPESASAFAL